MPAVVRSVVPSVMSSTIATSLSPHPARVGLQI